MTNKLKFFDAVCFNGETELLKFRLTELSEYVDHFIIAEYEDNTSKYLDSIELFSEWQDKITHIYITNDNLNNKIKSTFLGLQPNFEDILILSNTNEIPNLTNVGEFTEKLKFNPFVIEHTNFIWNKNYIDKFTSRGSIIFSFSLILQIKDVINQYIKLKSRINLQESYLLKNGWKFSNFNYESKYDYHIKNLLPPTEINPISTYKLIKHNGNIPLPKNLHLLPYFKIGRDEVKKHLFLVNSDLEFVNQDYYDTITIINFDSNIQETLCEKVSNKITKNVLYLPSKVLYGDPETFQDEYMMNETKRMFSVVFPQEQDVIEVIFKNEKPLVLGGVSN